MIQSSGERRGTRFEHRRGAILIVVLGVLVVLLLLATTFAGLSGTERNVTKNYLDTVRAKLAAHAGIEAAVARVSAGIDRGMLMDPAMEYWGSTVDEKNGTPNGTTPLEQAMNPSYVWEDEPVQNPLPDDLQGSTPMTFQIDGQKAGLSGMLTAGTYGANSDVYRLRVVDANSLIHLNDGAENGPQGNVSRNLSRTLDNLCTVLQIPPVGRAIVEQRPPGGYRLKRELARFFTSPVDFERFRAFVTVHAWTDPGVVNPVPISAKLAELNPDVRYNNQIGLYRYGRGRNAVGKLLPPDTFPLKVVKDATGVRDPNTAVIAMDEINAQWIERCRRAPVNMNLASREVLLATLINLQGFYVDERRRNNPAGKLSNNSYTNIVAYSFGYHTRYDLSPGGPVSGDEYGFLYTTYPFNYTPGSNSLGLANKVADEILACRKSQRSRHAPGLDYSKVWFGGPFRTWRQFSAFCDNLAERGVLRDPRPIHYDYSPDPAGGTSHYTGSNTLIVSPLQKQLAAQAMADVLKANFNPNCTLNELNPDANLYTLVDKTDLIRNSTEFCFTPMGYYEIESEGLILLPRKDPVSGEMNLLKTKEGKALARKKISCIVKAFDALRHTSQADFYEAELGGISGAADLKTNTNCALELGPEPDNGPAPKECRWSGWIQLSTIGGHWESGGQRHEPGTLETTPPGGPRFSAVAHGHFSLDHRLHYHAAGKFDPLEEAGDFRNFIDKTETVAGPYNPTIGPPGRHRLARDYRLKGENPPIPETGYSPDHFAPSDLRIDGAYVERDSCVMYENGPKIMPEQPKQGTVCYWVKPSFHPELATRPRTFFNMDAPHTRWRKPLVPPVPGVVTGFNQLTNQLIFGQWFLASHGPLNLESLATTYWQGPWHSASLVAGYSTSRAYADPPEPVPGGGIGVSGRSMNHTGHKHTPAREDLFRHHGWTHIIYWWKLTEKSDWDWRGTKGMVKLLVNGKTPGNGSGNSIPNDVIGVHPRKISSSAYYRDGQPFRLGQTSTPNLRNWPADATMDEFYLWKGDRIRTGQDLFQDGRYYCPLPGYDAMFRSKPVVFETSTGPIRKLPDGTSAGSGGTQTQPGAPVETSFRVIAVAWTWYPEATSDGKTPGTPPAGTPYMRDYQRTFNKDDKLEVRVEVNLLVDQLARATGLSDDGGTPVLELDVRPQNRFQYEFKVRLPEAKLGASLLATPIIDDITIYFSQGIEYLSFELQESAL